MPTNNKDFAITLKAIIDTAIDGILTINKEGIVETMNPAAAKIFGYKVEEVIGNNIKMLMPPPYHGEHDGYIDRYNKTRVPHIIGIGREVKGLKKDKSVFPFRLAVSEVVLNDRVIFTGVIHDLTDVKEAEELIIKLNRELEKKVSDRTYQLESTVNQLLATNKSLKIEVKERLIAQEKYRKSEEELKLALSKEKELNELKSRFVSMASHEFRTPLTSVLSSAAIIGKYTKEEQQPNRDKHINRIKSSVAHLTGILNDLLSLSKLEEGKVSLEMNELDVDKLCKEVVKETKGLIKDDQKVIYKLHGNGSVINADERIIRNILFNLISNAVKYSDSDIFCDMFVNEDNFEIRIKDSGIGIPEEDQKYLFSRFFRAGNVTNIQGTGLGLNIVKQYVDMLNGEITFESVHEKGTTFFVKVPYKN